MMEKNNIKWVEMPDKAILTQLGEFIKATRLDQNKTQQELANMAGVNRSTIVQLESGAGATMMSFIQVLRALDQLNLFESFQHMPVISPLLLAKQQQAKRQRARTINKTNLRKPISDW
jgi:transcriptional regulator with XRE-family HTH domain